MKAREELTLELEGESHTLGNALQKEISGHPQHAFVGYVAPHPQEDRMLLHVRAKEGADPKVVVRESCEALKQTLSELGESYAAALQTFEAQKAL